MTRSKHLILGANGFLGRNVAVTLARAGHPIALAVRRDPHPFPSDVDPQLIEHRPFDLTKADWASLVAGCDTIHHYAWSSIPQTAALDPVGDLDLNVRGTLELLEVMRRHGGQRLVFASSGGTVYGRFDGRPARENDPARPISAYGVGKLAAEHYIRIYRLDHGVDGRIARLSNPFGAGQDIRRNFGAVSTFIHKALTREPIRIWGDGEIVRDYVYIGDVVRAMIDLSMLPLTGDDVPILNVASGRGASLNELLAIIGRLLGRELVVEYSPGRSFDVRYNVLDTSRARHLLGWSPEVSLEEGISRMIEDIGRGANLYATT